MIFKKYIYILVRLIISLYRSGRLKSPGFSFRCHHVFEIYKLISLVLKKWIVGTSSINISHLRLQLKLIMELVLNVVLMIYNFWVLVEINCPNLLIYYLIIILIALVHKFWDVHTDLWPALVLEILLKLINLLICNLQIIRFPFFSFVIIITVCRWLGLSILIVIVYFPHSKQDLEFGVILPFLDLL